MAAQPRSASGDAFPPPTHSGYEPCPSHGLQPCPQCDVKHLNDSYMTPSCDIINAPRVVGNGDTSPCAQPVKKKRGRPRADVSQEGPTRHRWSSQVVNIAPAGSDLPLIEALHDVAPTAVLQSEELLDQDAEEEARTKFLERNRAAASRYREKNKAKAVDLERRARALQMHKTALQSAAMELQDEVVNLKSELLEHAGCSCTHIQGFIDGELNRAQKKEEARQIETDAGITA